MAARSRSTLWRTQNFLRRTTAVEQLIARSGLSPSDTVYDVGAGTGVLTALLAQRAGHVIAIEKDEALCQRLRRRFAGWPNVSVRWADVLEHPLPLTPYKVFANPPFDMLSSQSSRLRRRSLTTSSSLSRRRPPTSTGVVRRRPLPRCYYSRISWRPSSIGSAVKTSCPRQVSTWSCFDCESEDHRCSRLKVGSYTETS